MGRGLEICKMFESVLIAIYAGREFSVDPSLKGPVMQNSDVSFVVIPSSVWETVQLPVIWHIVTLMWRGCNDSVAQPEICAEFLRCDVCMIPPFQRDKCISINQVINN